MSEKKVVVPKEMLKCAINYTALPDGCGYDIVETILRRGLTYQSENPRVPTLEQWAECLTSIGLANNAILTEQMVPRKEIAAWIFRMYLAAPEPEYGVCKKCGARVQDGATKSHSSAAGTLLPGHTEPSVPEGIEDLTMDILSSENGTCRILVANALIKEAYRRGKESK